MDERKRKVDMSISCQGNIFWLHAFALLSIRFQVQQYKAALTSAGSLQIPSFIVSDEFLICGFGTTLRRRDNGAVAEIRGCSTESELAATNLERTCSSVRPLRSPTRIALALVVTRRYTAIPTKLGAKPTNTFAGIISEQPFSSVDLWPCNSTHTDPQHPISHFLVLLQVYLAAAVPSPSGADVGGL